MKKIACTMGVLWLACGALAFGARSRQIVDYRIQAQLVPEDKTVIGIEALSWLNDSEIPVTELQFHLYLNAFKNNRSTFMLESGGRHRGFKLDDENWGYTQIHRIQIRGGADLTGAVEYIQPDDDNPDDQTVMRVILPEPVPPQGRITLEIEFTAKLPKVFSRSGFHGDFYMVAQWFPKIGVLQDGEWNCHQYHSNSEFFADFGVYRVEITVPKDYVVGATGERIDTVENSDGTQTVTYYQEDVHDFAWTACPDFVEFREDYHLDDPDVNTEIILLVHREHLKFMPRYLSSLKNGIEFYSRSYGPYPYSTITLVDPAPGAMGAGGMEYPTLFTSMAMTGLPAGLRLPEMVTIHEFGHNYWYGMIGSNEFEEAWLDEGFNTYSEIKAMTKYYGSDASLIHLGRIKISDFSYQRFQLVASGKMDPVIKNSWDYLNGGSYSLNSYAKGGFVLLMLENILGEEVMSRVMKTYFERWQFKHPRTADFIAVAEEVSGRDLDWFFGPFLNSPDKLDYAVGSLRCREVPEPQGIFGDPTEESAAAVEADEAEKIFRSEVVVVRQGEIVFPQQIQVVFENGEEITENWEGRERWKRFVYRRTNRVVSAQIDPENKIVLDNNLLNNSRTLKENKTPGFKYGLGLMFTFQELLSFLSF